MRDTECVEFLQWCLPKLRLRWPGYRKVRGQVAKRVERRFHALGLPSLPAYREYLEKSPGEWRELDFLCRITISRFWRDRGVFDDLRGVILPAIARESLERREGEFRAWSAGCSSGEEAYSLALCWNLSIVPDLKKPLALSVTGTDIDARLLLRAQRGCYRQSSLKGLPEGLKAQAFTPSGDEFCVREHLKKNVTFQAGDMRDTMPEGDFRLILCRNLVFTYFEEHLQRSVLEGMLEKLPPGGILVIGVHEKLPPGFTGLVPVGRPPGVFRRASS
jgi:chemotaxis protein methyltransferase CheR